VRYAGEKLGRPAMTSNDTPLEEKTVQELQLLAAEAARAPATSAPRKPLSRAARLHLIDQLSRWGGSGLALFAGTAIFIATVVARNMPIRAAVWAVLLLAALYLCRRYRREFRRGDRIASRPFRWRAYYTATLAVVSAAFGAGAFLLTPKGVDPVFAAEIMTLMVIATVGATALHAPHPPSAAAAGLPAFALMSGAALRGDWGSTIALVALGVGLALLPGVFFASQRVLAAARGKFPRTSLIRREAAHRQEVDGESATEALLTPVVRA
jgi:hypothetical protein